MSYGPAPGPQTAFNPWNGYGELPAQTGNHFQAPDVSRVYVGPPEQAPKPRPIPPQAQTMTSYGNQPNQPVQYNQYNQYNQPTPHGIPSQPGQPGFNQELARRSTFIPEASPTDGNSFLPYLQPDSPRNLMTPGMPGIAGDPRQMPSNSSGSRLPPVPPSPVGPPPPIPMPVPVPVPVPAPAAVAPPMPVRMQTSSTMTTLPSSQSSHSLHSMTSLQSSQTMPSTSQEHASGRPGKFKKSKSARSTKSGDSANTTLPPVPPGHRISYHTPAVDIVGAHPSSSDHQPAPYPVMMKPSFTNAERVSMPVEAVMARYGQALPGDPVPAMSRINVNNMNMNVMAGVGAGGGMRMGLRPGMMMDEREAAAIGLSNNRYEPPDSQMQHQQNIALTPGLTPTQNLTQNLNQSQYRNSLPEPLHAIPKDAEIVESPSPNSLHPQPSQRKGNRLSRPSSRRAQSETTLPKQSSLAQNPKFHPSQNLHPGQLGQPPSPAEEPKRTSLVKKLTKKRPNSASTPEKRGQADKPTGQSGGEPYQIPIILPDVLFHVRATQAYEMQAYDELSFPAGVVIAVTSAPQDGRWVGWRIDKPETRKSPGVFYRTYVSFVQRVDSSRSNGSILFQVQAVCNYYATRPDEFDFSAGDIINVQSTPLGQFWVGFLGSEDPYSTNRGRLFPWKLVIPI